MRPDVNAICHAHPPTATGFAVAGRALNQALLPKSYSSGQIPLVQYATPGTPELSAALEPFIPHYDALLLANHGAVTCGPDLLTLFSNEDIEHQREKSRSPRRWPRTHAAFQRKSPSSWPRARAISSRPAGRGAELPVTCDNGETADSDVTLTRSELDALIDEAIRKIVRTLSRPICVAFLFSLLE